MGIRWSSGQVCRMAVCLYISDWLKKTKTMTNCTSLDLMKSSTNVKIIFRDKQKGLDY